MMDKGISAAFLSAIEAASSGPNTEAPGARTAGPDGDDPTGDA